MHVRLREIRVDPGATETGCCLLVCLFISVIKLARYDCCYFGPSYLTHGTTELLDVYLNYMIRYIDVHIWKG